MVESHSRSRPTVPYIHSSSVCVPVCKDEARGRGQRTDVGREMRIEFPESTDGLSGGWKQRKQKEGKGRKGQDQYLPNVKRDGRNERTNERAAKLLPNRVVCVFMPIPLLLLLPFRYVLCLGITVFNPLDSGLYVLLPAKRPFFFSFFFFVPEEGLNARVTAPLCSYPFSAR